MSDRRQAVNPVAMIGVFFAALCLVTATGCVDLPARNPALAAVAQTMPMAAPTPAAVDYHGLRYFDTRAAAMQTMQPSPVVNLSVTPAPKALQPVGAGQPLVVISFGNGCAGDGWGNGLRDLADSIRARFPSHRVITRAYNDDDNIETTVQNNAGPVILVGHSFGGWRTVNLAARVSRTIDAVVLLDPVPHGMGLFRKAGEYFRLPTNVRHGVCYFKPDSNFPVSYPINNPRFTTDNRPRDIGHNDFCRSPEVYQHVLSLCSQTTPQFARN